ncbi:MAG TPA: hypothetical protein VL588_01630 [Bdellovibrionota bacterium]|nr:hypothetical protein [Bdellovibrionota bacterium]
MKEDPTRMEQYLTVTRMTVRQVEPETLGDVDPRDLGSDVNEANVILDQIINMGQKVWKIVEDNKPVVNVSWTPADALPTGVQGWTSLESWQPPRQVAYQVSYENGFGMDVVDFTYRLIYTPGGSFQGKGKYLTRIAALAKDLDVSWGYTFNATGTVPSVVNAGTSSSPLAAAEVLVDWSIDTALKHSQSSRSYYVRGDGLFLPLDSD